MPFPKKNKTWLAGLKLDHDQSDHLPTLSSWDPRFRCRPATQSRTARSSSSPKSRASSKLFLKDLNSQRLVVYLPLRKIWVGQLFPIDGKIWETMGNVIPLGVIQHGWHGKSWKIPELNGGFHKKITDEWSIFHCYLWFPAGVWETVNKHVPNKQPALDMSHLFVSNYPT